MARTRILIQAGHQPPLQPGHEDETGAEGERELVVRIQKALVRLLRADDRFEPVPMPGRITDGVDVDAALFLHADGVDEPGPRGFSFGFPDFAVNRRLANLIAAEFERIPDHPPRRDDNITSDRAQYYGFGHVETPGPEVLVEHGFVSNPTEHRWLLRNVEALARAQHVALCRFFGVRPPDAVPPPPVPGALRPRSPLLGPPSAPPRRAIAHLLALEHGGYSDDDVRTLVRQYHRTCRAAGIDALVAVAQMTLETGHLTSFWSQRPRRNLAGIGVTGEEGVGLSFPTLRAAVRAHVGRLLAYALPAGTERGAQVRLVSEALAVRPLPAELRGAAPTLDGLVGRWAADPDYAVKIARIGNEIRRAG